MHGKGVYYYGNGDIYEGDWKDNLRDGSGTFYYKSKRETYKGTFHKGKKSGKGIFHYASGDQYDGNWSNNQKHGKGCIIYSSGAKYIGE